MLFKESGRSMLRNIICGLLAFVNSSPSFPEVAVPTISTSSYCFNRSASNSMAVISSSIIIVFIIISMFLYDCSFLASDF